MSKVRLPAIMLNADFYSKPRNRLWIAENGADAVIVLQQVWIASSQERDCKIKHCEVLALPFPIPIDPDRIRSILESAVRVGLLESDGDFYFNSQVVEDHKSFEIKRKNYSEGRKKGRKKDLESTENPDENLSESTENPIVYVYERERVNEFEKKGGAGERKTFDYKSGKTHHPPWVYLSDIELETFQINKGVDFVNRCIEKLNGWVGKDPNDPERRKAGENAGASFQNWVFKAVQKEIAEQAKTSNEKPTGQEKFNKRMEQLAKL